MEPRPVDRVLRVDALAEDGVGHADEGGPEPAAAGRADRQRGPSPSSASEGAIMLSIRSPDERPEEELRLAEHAVELEVESGQVVARAEPEARGEDADVAPAGPR